jgi:hypothetical protein
MGRYSPIPQCFVQVGVCRMDQTTYAYDPINYTPSIHTERAYRGFAGAGVAGPVGAITWGVELIGLVALVAAFSNSGW